MWESLRGPVGASALVTALGLVALALAAGRPQPGIWPWVGVAGSAAALAGFVVEGHTRTMTPRWAMVGFDLVHLAAGAVWLGGLAVVVLAFRHGTTRDEQSALVVQFSNTAVIAVLAVTAPASACRGSSCRRWRICGRRATGWRCWSRSRSSPSS